MKFNSGPSLERVLEAFYYDASEGCLRWKIDTNSRGPSRIGKRAGYLSSLGYFHVRLDGNIYLAHRIIWLYHKGYWPKGEIDHANGNPSDNRIDNLREATRSQQGINRRKFRSQTGIVGVCKDGHRKGWWTAELRMDGVTLLKKRYRTKDEAVAARKHAEAVFHQRWSPYISNVERDWLHVSSL